MYLLLLEICVKIAYTNTWSPWGRITAEECPNIIVLSNRVRLLPSIFFTVFHKSVSRWLITWLINYVCQQGLTTVKICRSRHENITSAAKDFLLVNVRMKCRSTKKTLAADVKLSLSTRVADIPFHSIVVIYLSSILSSWTDVTTCSSVNSRLTRNVNHLRLRRLALGFRCLVFSFLYLLFPDKT